jgi:hypothetical protein
MCAMVRASTLRGSECSRGLVWDPAPAAIVEEVAGDPLCARGRVEADRDVDQSDREVARQEPGRRHGTIRYF